MGKDSTGNRDSETPKIEKNVEVVETLKGENKSRDGRESSEDDR